MLLMVEKGIRDGMCHAIYRYPSANRKYMKSYNHNKELSYLMYWDANSLCWWGMSQKLPVNGFKWRNDIFHSDENFLKCYDKDSDKGYIFEVGIEYFENLHNLRSNLTCLPERMKFKKSM